ncbi:succinate dehydrogenase, hydrophobic membrane anchor protein [Nitrosomonas sp. ANs5]|uniref:succinate dehydrogenase, hydrophobic membrane anchor protein n=1 Tax=Nitrosomonas sp. ANs5 TaxID=3423941 RepID=UPI003D32D800
MVRPAKRVVTGAHYGLRDWLVQRVTAVLMGLYTGWLVMLVIFHQPADYEAFRSLFAGQWMKIASFVFFASLCWHAWVGVRNVLMDYVHPIAIRLTLQIACIVALFTYLVWFVVILWS